ncbi:hypothetical protein SDC9_155619 [bioreactor metagenome]|uniref:Glycosyltransferase 2-like domain-containing protein n=1 Tax=bioreactor metagenome TaxID=1076179 RepID=A0A645F292_9ZZZZ
MDDDETVTEGWLESHVVTAAQYSADATFGPVLPAYSSEVPYWIKKLDFFSRVNLTTGGPVRWPATNNVRMHSRFLDSVPTLRFSEEYSLTGGEDTDFFYRAREHGASLVWTSEGLVRGMVPANRANARWLWRRGLRLGNVSARMLRRRGWSSGRILVVACARVLASPLLAAAAAIRKRPVGPEIMHIPKGVGMVAALRGRLVQEYERGRAGAG